MLTKIITLCALQLLALPVFASEENIAQKQSATQQIEKLKEHIPVPELQKIILEYLGNEPIVLDKIPILTAAQSLNGIYLISAGYNEKIKESNVKIWKFENGKYMLAHEITVPFKIIRAAISNDGKYLALENDGRYLKPGTNFICIQYTVYVLQLKNNRYDQIQYFNSRNKSISLEFFGDSKLLGRTTRFWHMEILQFSPETNTFVDQDPINNPELVGPKTQIAAFSPDAKYIAALQAVQNGNIALWQILNNKITFINESIVAGQLVDSMAISPNGNYLAIGTFSPQRAALCKIFSKKNNRLEPHQTINNDIIETLVKESRVESLKFSYDGTYLAVATHFHTEDWVTEINILKLNQKSGLYEKIATLPRAANSMLVGFSPNNSVITINNGMLIIWENQKKQLEQDTGEKIKSAAEQEQAVVTEVD